MDHLHNLASRLVYMSVQNVSQTRPTGRLKKRQQAFSRISSFLPSCTTCNKRRPSEYFAERVTDPAYWSSQKATAGIQQNQQFFTQLYNLQQTQALGKFRAIIPSAFSVEGVDTE